MLKTLEFEAQFASTGKTLKGTHTFEKGMTAIVGHNEAGKSMRIEMFRYAWFGVKALRSSLSTYKSLSVKSTIVVAGQEYSIKRTLSSVSLFKDKTELATGTKPVNAAVIRILGYDMEVFDVSNACLQGEIEAMTKKTPAERKRMIDRTIGLDAIDDMVKDYSAQIVAAHKTVDLLEKTNSEELTLPEKPNGYAPVKHWEDLILNREESLNTRKQYEAELRVLQCEEPQPVDLTIPEAIETLYTLQSDREVAIANERNLRSQLTTFGSFVEVDLRNERARLQEYIDTGAVKQWAEYSEYSTLVNAVRKPVVTDEEKLKNFAQAWEVWPYLQTLRKLEAGQTIDCPNCDHKFHLQESAIDHAREELLRISMSFDPRLKEDEVEGLIDEAIQYKILSSTSAKDILGALETYNKVARLTPIPEPILNYIGTENEVQSQITIIDMKIESIDKKAKLETQLAEAVAALNATVDYSEKIRQKRLEIEALSQYNVKLQAWQKYNNARLNLQPKIDTMSHIETDVAHYRTTLQEVRLYDSKMQDYTTRKDMQDKVKEQIAALMVNVEAWTNIRKGLNDIKPKVKSYLIPSLSRVASNFLSEMTNSERNRIDINDEFEIIVDGQPVETLSGSAKAVANLAVRLGLGTVLTNKVFSVLFVDEVDASMDAKRAQYTAQCLRNLTKVFGQIILVSHQKPEADHYIEL